MRTRDHNAVSKNLKSRSGRLDHAESYSLDPSRGLGKGERRLLDELYRRFNRPKFIFPDPLALVLPFADAGEQEVAGLIAAALSFGNVQTILRSAGGVLAALPRPAQALRETPCPELNRRFHGFRHRYVGAQELVDFLCAIQAVLRRYGSLEQCFLVHYDQKHSTVLPALCGLSDELRKQSSLPKNYLLPDPRRGSACKRWCMWLRWMIRRDSVDPGPWRGVPPAKLIVPVDTHIYRIALRLDWTRRRNADLRTALEITAALRSAAPDDPIRYDFALSRLGIRSDMDLESFFNAYAIVRDDPEAGLKLP